LAGQPQVAALERLEPLQALWQAIGGNRDRSIDAISGHRSIEAGPLWLVLVDTSTDVFTKDDAAWLDAELAAVDQPIAIAIHQPPFETGIWWMDCVGLKHAERFEAVEREHPHVIKVVSGHIHRLIQTHWGTCSLWVWPSTSATIAADLDPAHAPVETAEPPAFSLHAWTDNTIVSHLIPVGPSALCTPIGVTAADFVAWARSQKADRPTVFSYPTVFS
jgi:hypothetical protein